MQLQTKSNSYESKFKHLNSHSVRPQVNIEKIDQQKTEQFVQTQQLIENESKWWNLKRKKISFLIFLLISLGIGLIVFNVSGKSNDQPLQDIKQKSLQDSDIYDYVVLNTTTALCLDGSPGAYFISKNGNPQNVYLHFQSGGWCGQISYEGTLQSCYGRSKSYLGSSKFKQPQSVWASEGIFSQNQRNYFKDWKKVYLLYCDGSGHQGSRNDPIQYKDTFLYFRGHNLTVERLQSLQKKIGLFSKAKRIVVSGQSAGGPASVYWANYIADRAKKAKISGFIGSGIFLDSVNSQTNTYNFREKLINLMNITNKQINNPQSQCVKQYPDEQYKCMFVQYFYQFLKVPIFISQSLYDAYSIPYIIGISCNSVVKDCPQDKQKIIQQYRQNATDLLTQIGKDKRNGIWAIDCAGHSYWTESKFYSQNFQVPQHSGNTISKAFQNWIENKKNQHVFIDKVQWPNNLPCRQDFH